MLDAGATTSLWRVTQIALAALIEAIVAPITIDMLRRPSRQFHKRLANPKRNRKQAVNYPQKQISYTSLPKA
jgi:hypothetical protein